MPVESIVRIVISIIILIIIIVILSKFQSGKSQPNAKDSLTIMKERLHRGAITEEEFNEAKRRRGKYR